MCECQYVLVFLVDGFWFYVNLYQFNLCFDELGVCIYIMGVNEGQIDIVLLYVLDIFKFGQCWLFNLGLCEDYYCMSFDGVFFGISMWFKILGNLLSWKLVVIYKLIGYSSVYVLLVIVQ